jgi:hypothetical protein
MFTKLTDPESRHKYLDMDVGKAGILTEYLAILPWFFLLKETVIVESVK